MNKKVSVVISVVFVLFLIGVVYVTYMKVQAQKLIGIWYPDYEDDITIQFNRDQSGIYYDDLTKVVFHWDIRGSTLQIVMQDNLDVYQYVFEDDKLYLTSSDGSVTLYKYGN